MWIRALALVSISLACLAPTPADAKRPTLNAIEKRQLPQYCWGSHHGEPKKYAGLAEYSIPGSCGKFMNHLCVGHVYLIAARRPTESPRQRNFFAQKAISNFEYTQRGMTPVCPLRTEVEGSIALARMLGGRR
jgi:hypothetical protein